MFLAQKLAGKPFTVVGDGTQSRDFTFVTDVVEAFVRAAKSDVTGGIFNVGSGDSYSINRLVELLGGDVVHVPKRPGEPDCTLVQDWISGLEPCRVNSNFEIRNDWLVLSNPKSAIRNPKWAVPYFVDDDQLAARRCCQ